MYSVWKIDMRQTFLLLLFFALFGKNSFSFSTYSLFSVLNTIPIFVYCVMRCFVWHCLYLLLCFIIYFILGGGEEKEWMFFWE
jgi:hypothetical protein